MIKSSRKLKYYVSMAVFSLLFCCVLCRNKVFAATDIRVGLKALYMGKSIITIYTTDLKMGYCLNDVFKADIELKSAGGFSFEPENKEYYTDNLTYGSYSKAFSELKEMLSSDSKASGSVCYAGRGKWLVYIKNPSEKKGLVKASSSELVKLSFGQRTILIDGSVSDGYPQFAPAGKEKTISLGSRSYRGRIEIGRYGSNSLSAINIVNIESYLLSVVSCEMNSTWHSEAQKAQAIAARSYCLANTGFTADSYLKKGYVIVDTDESQVYAGTSKETEMSRYAVKSTLKQILKVNGKVLPAYFFSTSGGATEFSADIWGGNSSTFVNVFDEYEIYPERAPWIIKTTISALEEKLRAKGINANGVTSIYPEMVSDSGRVSSIKIKYKNGSTSIKGSVLKSMYDMHSTKFKIITSESEDFDVVLRSTIEDADKTGVSGNGNKGSSGEKKYYDSVVTTSELYTISGTGQIKPITETTDQLILISSDNMTNFPLEKPSENEVWFLGMGWGHGIGMSQSGAYGMARKGFKYDEILKYYYKNVELATY